jgi:hypothetical protein
VVTQALGECVSVTDIQGMEVTLPDGLLLPPVRQRSELGLPLLWPSDWTGE